MQYMVCAIQIDVLTLPYLLSIQNSTQLEYFCAQLLHSSTLVHTQLTVSQLSVHQGGAPGLILRSINPSNPTVPASTKPANTVSVVLVL